MFKRSYLTILGSILLLALITVACGGGAPTAGPTSPPVVVTSPPVIQTVMVAGTPQQVVVTVTPAPTKVAPTGVGAKSISVNANWTGAERAGFQAVLDGFTAKTGITVQYESDRDNLEAVVQTRIAGGNPPDIVMESRPGFIQQLARAGNLIQLDQSGNEVIKPSDLSNSLGQTYIDLGKVDSKLYGLAFKTDSKSTFWYKPASFKTLGVQTPKTLDDLFAIADKYKAAGKVPFAAGGKDAWTLTDYFENLYMRVASPQMYLDLHVTHKVPWTDPTVIKALTLLTKFFQPGYNPGGTQGVLGTGFTDSIAQTFGASPSAEMYYEGGFVGTIVLGSGGINPSLKPVQDMDFFLFPQVDPAFDDPVEGGGDLAIMLKDSPEGRSFMNYLITKEAGELYAGTDQITPNKLVDPTKFKSPLRAKEFQILASAKVFLFDGSDLAPNSFGGGDEFTELQKLVQNPGDVNKIAGELEDAAKKDYTQ